MIIRLIIAVLFFVMSSHFLQQEIHAFERVLILNSAASSIFQELKLSHLVVGTIRSDDTFPGLTRVGSHLRPNIELIKVLKPDLIVAGSKRAFPNKMKEKLGIDIFRYDPGSLQEIMAIIEKLAGLFNRQQEGGIVISRLKILLNSVKQVGQKVNVVYEISERTLKVAGRKNIVTSIIDAAGGRNLIEIDKKHVLISPEKVLKLNPDIYIFQNGPMNKNPENPKERNFFKTLKSQVIEVNQLEFTRAGLNAFYAVVKLNTIFKDFRRNKNNRVAN